SATSSNRREGNGTTLYVVQSRLSPNFKRAPSSLRSLQIRSLHARGICVHNITTAFRLRSIFSNRQRGPKASLRLRARLRAKTEISKWRSIYSQRAVNCRTLIRRLPHNSKRRGLICSKGAEVKNGNDPHCGFRLSSHQMESLNQHKYGFYIRTSTLPRYST